MARPARPSLSAAVLLGLDRGEGDPATRPLRVLMAEADPGRREMLRVVLEAAGDAALCVGSWDQALGELSRQPVDAVILALDLPGSGGLAAARVLRGWPAPVSALPLLALHAGTARLQETAWREAGFDALLHWPAGRAEMATLLRAVVVRLTPPAPLDPAQRAALREAMGPEALAAHDQAMLVEAGALLARLRAAPDAAEASAAAEALAEACRSIGAVAAAAAAGAAARQFPPAIEPLMGALAAAGSAIRFEGRARR
jgi:DNA-binding response OmpR family regulator